MRVIENAPGIWVKILEINAKSINRYKYIGLKNTPYSPIRETAFKRRKTLDYLFFYPCFTIDLSPLKQRFLYIILTCGSILLAKEQTWTTTTFDYYWNVVIRRNIYREPISFTPFDVRVGQLTYGGSNYWDSKLSNTNLGEFSPIVLDSVTADFDTITRAGSRKLLLLEVDFLRLNILNYLYHQNYIDLQFGLGYSRISTVSPSELPELGAWGKNLPNGNTLGEFMYSPKINTMNFNTTLTLQATNFLLGYIHHSLGYSSGTLYESTGGDEYLKGNGISEAFSLGIRLVFHPPNKSFSLVYGLEGRWHRTKFLSVNDPSYISHITGLDLYAKGILITLGTIFGGGRTSGDYGFSHLLNQRYDEASREFEQFIDDYPHHFRRNKAKEMLSFSDAQIPYQKFKKGIKALKIKEFDDAVFWFNKAIENADKDLLFEINSRKKDIAMALIDSVTLHKAEMDFSQAEDIIQKARKIAPDYPVGVEALAELYLEKGDVLFQHKNFNKSYDYYKQALELSNVNEKGLKNKYIDLVAGFMDEANTQAEQGDYILSIKSLETIIEIHPEREADLSPIIDKMKILLEKIESDNILNEIKSLMQLKQKELNENRSYMLLLGMTLHQATEITGEPTFIDKIDRGGRLYEMWSFDNHPKAKRLYFEDNLLVKIEK